MGFMLGSELSPIDWSRYNKLRFPLTADLWKVANAIVSQHMRTSEWSSKTDICEQSGRFNLDCSSFLTYCLSKLGFKFHGFPLERRHLSVDYFDFLSDPERQLKSRLRSLTPVSSIQPGDIIVWKNTETKRMTTGHCMISAGHPVKIQTTTPRPEYTLLVFDSVKLPHGSLDNRYTSQSTGLGMGQVTLVADTNNGKPIAFRWDGTGRLNNSDIVLGRLH